MLATVFVVEMGYMLRLGCWAVTTALDAEGRKSLITFSDLVWLAWGVWVIVVAVLWWMDRRFADSFEEFVKRTGIQRPTPPYGSRAGGGIHL